MSASKMPSPLPAARPFARFFVAAWLLLFPAAALPASPVAFPGALGYGAGATGGRGGTIYHVTNLNDSGAGSFRDAVSAGGRVIVFDVGGNAQILSPVSTKSNLTIAGQTAPGDGFGIYGSEVSFANATNIIVRHMRFRDGTLDPNYPGKSSTNSHTNALGLYNTNTLIFDHCCMEFAAYNNVDATSCVNLTFQNSLFADPIKEQQFNGHFETGPHTFIDNVWANSHGRNPLGKSNLQYVNNIVYNYQYAFTTGNSSGTFSFDIINNYFIAGPSTNSANDDFYQVDTNQSAYATGNLLDGNKDGSLNGSSDNTTGAVVLAYPWSPTTTSLPTLSPANAYVYCVANAGPLPRDQVDTLVMNDVTSLGTSGMLWVTQTSTGFGNDGYGVLNGGPKSLDSDSDGMPDYWEDAMGLNKSSAADANTVNADGYTNIEEYLNWLAVPHYWAQVNTPADIDLTQYTPGLKNVTFAVTSGSNGTTTLKADGHTAHFVPSTSAFKGLAAFSFTASTSVGSFTASVAVLVSPDAPPLPPVNLLWNGGVSSSGTNIWDNVVSNKVWITTTGSASGFAIGDNVTFDDTSAHTSVSPGAAVAPGSITVSTYTNNYVFAASGSAASILDFLATSLTKSGPAGITISGSNSFAGGTAVNGGTVTLNNSFGLGSGPIYLNNSALILNTSNGGPPNAIVISGTCTVTAGSASVSLANSTSSSVSGTDTLIINPNGGTFTIPGAMDGFAGTITLANHTGTFRINGTGAANLGSAAATFDLGTSSATINNRNGGITINLGALTGGTGTTLQGRSSSSGATATTYIIGATDMSTTFSGAIINGGDNNGVNITKSGTGTLTLTGVSTYTGATTVSAGTLFLTGTLGNTAVTIASGATLAGGGAIGSSSGGAVSTGSNAIITPGNASLTGATLRVGNGLSLNRTTLIMDLSGTAAGPNNDMILMTGGALSLTGTQTFQFNLVNGTLGNGTYMLVTGGTSTTGSGPGLASNLPSNTRQNLSLQRSSAALTGTDFIQLVVSGTPSASLAWSGSNGNVWDLNSTSNWSGSPTGTFFNLDSVTFSDGSNGSVSVSSIVNPASITVNNSATNYTLSGAGSIGGAGGLTKSGTGSLAISMGNFFSGATTINAGTVTLNSANAAGTGTIILNGGTLKVNAFIGNNIMVTATSTISAASQQTLSGTLSTTGTQTLIINPNSSVLSLATPMSGFKGIIELGNNVGNGVVRMNASTNTNFGSTSALFDLGTNSAWLINRNGNITIDIGALMGGLNTVLRGASATTAPTTYSIGALGMNTTFAGQIQDGAFSGTAAPVAIIKAGAGSLALTNSNSYSGGTEVSSGLLLANNASGSALGGGDAQVDAGAAFGGNGSMDGSLNISGSATLSPGNGIVPGTLNVNGDLALDDTSTLNFDVGTAASDLVTIGGDLTLGGTLNVSAFGGLRGGVYTLFHYTGAFTQGNLVLGAEPANYLLAVDGTSSAGQVNLIVTSPFQQWQALYFGSGYAGNPSAAMGASASNDGISNLLKYALGLNPLKCGAGGLPKVGVDNVNGFLTLTYAKVDAATDMLYTVYWSDDLKTWNTNGITQQILSDNGTLQSVIAKVAKGGKGSRFIDLQVTQQ